MLLIAQAASAALSIGSAVWDGQRLTVSGSGDRNETVTVRNAYQTTQVLGTSRVSSRGSWSVRASNPNPVPCAVTASAPGDTSVTRAVTNAPTNCAPNPNLACNIAVAPTALAFADVNVGSPATLSTTVSNSGTAACSVTLVPTGSNDFVVTSVTNFNVAPNSSASVSVSYTPAQAGADSGNVAVNSNDPDTSTVNVGLSGNGVQQQVQCNPANLDVSINSTSQNGCPDTAITEQSVVANNSYSVLAINDLGMHCGDLDTRIASILPPFQVLLAQVVQKGATPTLNPAGVSVRYSAASNPADPILGSNVFDGVLANGDTYKTNFWDGVNKGTYDPFYPGGLGITPLTTGGFPVTPDVGLPVPNVEELYIGADGLVDRNCAQNPASCDGTLTAVQHAMPGITNPYVANAPQTAKEHYLDKPFFVNFPFGYVAAGVNWYEGAGVPFAAFDDSGRENAYPLVRVQAVSGVGVVSTVDTVLPISGEASCTNCHATNADYTSVHGVPNRTDIPTDQLAAAGLPVATSLDDPDSNMPPKVSLEYAADINVLRLHDLTHGGSYVSTSGAADPCTINNANPAGVAKPDGTSSCLTHKALVEDKPVVCQVCHYTPALDLAQVGPMAGPEGTTANGRNQLAHESNSRVMHTNHGSITALDRNGIAMFPPIPAPTQTTAGIVTNQASRLDALENSCYQCHPGTNVQCLRGAMFNGDMLCSDCHGSMAQVGDDFSKNVSPSNPGAFILGQGNFYDPANTTQPRVPWANEPGCGACHTGDANSNLATSGNVLVNTRDSTDNLDGIRLRQAWRTGDGKATPIVPTNKRFAEPAVPASFNGFANPGAGNPQLYRVSTGHGGVMCEGCHGATHAEWPNANPNGNDNIAAGQLQGHVGAVIECGTCHTSVDSLSPNGSADSMRGPHGLHAVGNTEFARSKHKESWSTSTNDTCRACHGQNGTGTVLSRMATDRTLQCKEGGDVCKGASSAVFKKGHMVGCDDCHGNEINRGADD